MMQSNEPPNTTLEEDLHSAGQRKINLIWEYTQAFISVVITLAFIYVNTTRTVESSALNNTFFVVIGFYFGRTNHQRVGGVLLGR